jgi:cardiolipin synthase
MWSDIRGGVAHIEIGYDDVSSGRDVPVVSRTFVTALRQFRAAPNLLTMLRLFVLPFLVITVLDRHWGVAFALLWVAGVSDGLDGLLARALQQRTTLGLYLDPIADKLLLSTMFVVLTHVGAIPRYVTVLVLSRDVGILLIATLLFATNTLRHFLPSKLGKLNTLVQIMGVLTVMTCEVFPRSGLRDLRIGLLWAIAALAPISAAEYAWIVIRRVSEPVEATRSGA